MRPSVVVLAKFWKANMFDRYAVTVIDPPEGTPKEPFLVVKRQADEVFSSIPRIIRMLPITSPDYHWVEMKPSSISATDE